MLQFNLNSFSTVGFYVIVTLVGVFIFYFFIFLCNLVVFHYK